MTENEIAINFVDSQIWDESAVGAVGAIIKVKQQLEKKGLTVHIQGLNSSSEQLFRQFI